MSRSERSLTDTLLAPQRPESTYKHTATQNGIVQSYRKQSISEVQNVTDLTHSFRTAEHAPSRSIVYYDYYNKEIQSRPIFERVIDGYRNDWTVLKNEFGKCSSFWQWLGLWRARNIQHGTDVFELGRRFHAVPPIGSICRSCDILNGTLMLALWGRIKYCQDNNMTIWRGKAAFLFKPLLLVFGVHQVFIQSSTLDTAIKYNYQTWQDPLLFSGPLAAQLIENQMLKRLDNATADSIVPEIFKMDQEQNKRRIAVPELYGDEREWETEKEEGIKYETHLKEQKAVDDIHLRDKEDGFVSAFFEQQRKYDRYQQAYQILKDKDAREKFEEMRLKERLGLPDDNPLTNATKLSSLPPEPSKSS